MVLSVEVQGGLQLSKLKLKSHFKSIELHTNACQACFYQNVTNDDGLKFALSKLGFLKSVSSNDGTLLLCISVF